MKPKFLTQCGHDRLYSEECPECDVMWHQMMYEVHIKDAAMHLQKLDEAKEKIRERSENTN